MNSRTHSHPVLRWLCATAALLAWSAPVSAQTLAPSEVTKNVKIEQNLDAQLPLELEFKDETGKTVKLADYFGKKKPVVLALVYYQCPQLCTMTLNGMSNAFKTVGLKMGEEYDVVTVSFDPKETPELAAKKKASYVKDYGQSGADVGWHFLTGEQPAIDQLCDTVGFKYAYDQNSGQFAHGSAIMVITPQGRVSGYFYGLEYSSRDLRLGLVEASEGKVGTVRDALNLLCYEYDITTGKYGLMVSRLLKGGAGLTVACIAVFIFVMARRERRSKRSFSAVPAGA